MIKKGLIGVAVFVVVLLSAMYFVFGDAFLGMSPMVDNAPVGSGGAVLIADGYVGLYLLPGDANEAALVDSGNDPTGRAVLAALAARKLTKDAVKAVFLTHGHPDHTAGAQLFPGAQVYAFAADVKMAAAEEKAKGPLTSRLDFPKEKGAKVTKTLTDGETISVGSLQVRAFAVPGHTPGSAAFLSNGVLFLGDSAGAKADGKTIRGAPWAFTDDQAQNKASLKALHARLKAENVEVKTLAFGHTAPIDGMDALLNPE